MWKMIISALWLVLGLLGGASLVVQASLNSGLRERLQSVTWAAFVSYLGGTISMMIAVAGVKVTVLADRGFGDQALYELSKDQLGLDFVVRFRGIVKVTDEHGVTKTANEWVPDNGRPRLLSRARVTKARREVGAVVCVKAKGMKEP